MIRTVNGELVAECSECGAEYAGGTLDWQEFIRDLKESGWLIRKDGAEWIHVCDDCLAEGV